MQNITEYYAFVESLDKVSNLNKDIQLSKEWDYLLDKWHDIHKDKKPTHIIWLDAISSEYFNTLEWRFNKCDPTNANERDSRKKQISKLKSSEFKVFFVLLSIESHKDFIQLFLPSSWHSIQVSTVPSDSHTAFDAIQSSDYDQDDPIKVSIVKFKEVPYETYINPDSPLPQLLNVFSIDHIADEQFNDNEKVRNGINNNSPQDNTDVLKHKILQNQNLKHM